MNWHQLSSEEQLKKIIEASYQKPQVIFKHSTRCSISGAARARLEKSAEPEGIEFHYLDLLSYRPLSNKIAETFHVHHESPQVLLIKKGECIFDESHLSIYMEEIIEQAAK
ncbi:MAG: bacillithiol system redox-active protein YtxJ [Chitinophagaceae bacterium]|jgi:bacillithiol system protein YtxJ|nr:bacillithiol system redox-active protein YtxJ [Chitinophagaceae bacterium]MBK8952673.1 bacillithiol system redox-active protein YtxJ [Chitinophagaceae bacterium]